jgi:pilus assembly protein CpaE
MTSSIVVRFNVSDPEVERALRQIIEDDPDFVISDADDSTFVNILVTELSLDDPASTFSRIEELAETSPGTAVCLTANGADPALLLKVLRAGIKEFLPQPLDPEDVGAAFGRLKEHFAAIQAAAGGRRGQVLCVLGGKAGIGTTTLAVNLASMLHAAPGDRAVAIVDLNLRGGDVTTFLDMSVLRGLHDIDSELGRLDDTYLSSIISRHTSGLHVMPLGEVELGGGYVTAECVERTLEIMKGMFDLIVVDCGSLPESAVQAALQNANQVIIVSSVTVPVVRRTKRILAELPNMAELLEAGRLSLVLSQCAARDQALIDDVSRTLGLRAVCEIPHDHDAVVQAINDGLPVYFSAPKHSISRAVESLASEFWRAPEQIKSKSFLGGMFRSLAARGSKGGGSEPVS